VKQRLALKMSYGLMKVVCKSRHTSDIATGNLDVQQRINPGTYCHALMYIQSMNELSYISYI